MAPVIDRPRQDVEVLMHLNGPIGAQLPAQWLPSVEKNVSFRNKYLSYGRSGADRSLDRMLEYFSRYFSLGLVLVLNSPGGNQDVRGKVSDVIDQLGCDNTTAYVPYVANSAGAKLFHASGYKFIGPSATTTLHASLSPISGGFALADGAFSEYKNFIGDMIAHASTNEGAAMIATLFSAAASPEALVRRPDAPITFTGIMWPKIAQKTNVMSVVDMRNQLRSFLSIPMSLPDSLWKR